MIVIQLGRENMKMAFQVSKNSTSKTIYNRLREEIIKLYIVPGTSISEKEISEKYNVSRTPVREAFAQENIFALEMNLKLQDMHMENRDHKKLFEEDEEFHK